MKSSQRVIALVAAASGAGKTTLMEGVIKSLKKRGYRVGVVKHSIHDADFDREGSDSRRLHQAGADVTVLAAKGQLAVIRNVENPSLETAIMDISPDTDIVLVEGFKEADVPKIEVFRSGFCSELYCRGTGGADPSLVAVASDVSLDLDVPVLDLNSPEEVCEFIIRHFMIPIN